MELELILKMLLAAVLGGIIGLERELSHREGGVRVHILIALACSLLTVLTLQGAEGADSRNVVTSPMLGHIIIALGLMGAGIIVKERYTFQGLGTAAIAWSVGAIGIAVGSGLYLAAFAAAIFIVIALTLLKRLTPLMEKQGKFYAYVISTEERAAIIIEIKKIIMDLGIRYQSALIRKTRDGYEIEMAVTTSQTKNKAFIERVMQIPDVKEITSENL
jgi:putative Mg2+ transporter-C (MgtC) family protein